jgi:hypothetical protein
VNLKITILSFFLLLSGIVSAQSFNYSYTDPCNGNVYNLTIPYGQDQIAVTYYGQVNTFTANDFNNGAFDQWAANVFNQFQNASPCGGIGTTVTISQTQSTALNIVGIFNSLSAISDMASSGAGNIMGAASSMNNVGGGSGNKGGNKNSQNQGGTGSGNNSSGGQTGSNSTPQGQSQGQNVSGGGQSGSNNTSQGQTQGQNGSTGGSNQTSGTSSNGGSGSTNGGGTQDQNQSNGNNSTGTSSSNTSAGNNNSGGNTTQGNNSSTENTGGSGGSNETGGTGNANSGSGSTNSSGGTTTSGTGSGGSGGNGTTNNNQTQTTEEKKSDAVGGTTNAIKGGSGGSNGKSSTNSKNGGRPSILASSDLVGFQFNEGEINRGTKVNAGYTSVRYDGLRSHGFMVDYTSAIQGGNITGYYAWIKPKAITLLANTVTIGFSGSGSLYNTVAFGQMRNIKKFKAVYMLTASGGQIYRQSYYGSAAIVGGNRDFKLGKRIDVKTMMLFVYAPFVRYYDDAVLKSPYVILPIVGVNLGVTKTFKLNFNFGGAYSIGDNVLNYTVMMGTRLAL